MDRILAEAGEVYDIVSSDSSIGSSFWPTQASFIVKPSRVSLFARFVFVICDSCREEGSIAMFHFGMQRSSAVIFQLSDL